eukprot:CAMPEP_0172313698 /NCGR_PEP_ID=MMETSP1058-20130122/20786_1 /TAXON_ID=83371 /ORGANISM="Detonula confervacea, Strain CCMP 353" /LENGTH=137 /DNA_ID=CAMNT_0013027399 /DNA_START=330 /DNA_END=743 /DNA_ORIENTATION=+
MSTTAGHVNGANLRLAASHTKPYSPLCGATRIARLHVDDSRARQCRYCASRRPFHAPTVPFAAPLASIAFTSTTAAPVNGANLRLAESHPQPEGLLCGATLARYSPSRRRQQPPSMAAVYASRRPHCDHGATPLARL